MRRRGKVGVLLLALLSTSALASRADRLSVSPRLDRRDRLGAAAAANPILLSLSLLPPDSECSGTPPDGVTFTRASAATCIKSDGAVVALASNQPRVHGTLGLLVEGTATNAVLYSRDVTALPWVSSGCVKDSEGLTNSKLPAAATCTGPTTATQTLTVPTGTRTLSVYMKGGASPCSVTLYADTESAAVSPGQNTWTRSLLTYTSDGEVDITIDIEDSCDVEIDYVQDEAGSVATSPIATTGTAAVRAGDVSTVPNPRQSDADAWCWAITGTPLGAWNSRQRMLLSTGPFNVAGSQYISLEPPSVGFAVDATDEAGATGYKLGRTSYANLPADAATHRIVGAFTVSGVPSIHLDGASQTMSVMGPGSGIAAPTQPIISIGVYRPSNSIPFFGHLRNLVLGATPEACQ